MAGTPYFERLVATAERISRHATFPGKDLAVGQCLDDLEDLAQVGRINPEQHEVLRSILLGALVEAA